MAETTYETMNTELSILLKPADVTRRLNISRSLTYRLLQQGQIPTVRFGHSIRVRSTDLEEFIRRNLTEQA